MGAVSSLAVASTLLSSTDCAQRRGAEKPAWDICSAFSGLGGVDVKIVNDCTEDVVVTVYDMSTEPRSVVLAHERINGFTTVPLSLVAALGLGHKRPATATHAGAHDCGRRAQFKSEFQDPEPSDLERPKNTPRRGPY
jgi:hypothetical protein